jgi:hypothetical protein
VRTEDLSALLPPAAGDGWLHNLKQGDRLLVIVNGRGGLRLMSLNGLTGAIPFATGGAFHIDGGLQIPRM